ncbi:MAG: hypothetical protein JW738_07720 [Actinobacteria bacterium]|nr:hypothetical protein [Actinomycetota bacterium]
MSAQLKIIVTDEGKKSLNKLTPEVQREIIKKIVEYNEKPELITSRIKHMKGSNPPMIRLRPGEYRALGALSGSDLYLNVLLDRKNL